MLQLCYESGKLAVLHPIHRSDKKSRAFGIDNCRERWQVTDLKKEKCPTRMKDEEFCVQISEMELNMGQVDYRTGGLIL